MEQQTAQAQHSQPSRQQIPTHLSVPDKILAFWGFGITVRQLLFLLVGWSAVANTWVRLAFLTTFGPGGVALHVVASSIPAIIVLVLAFKQIAGRYIEQWVLVLLRYWQQPHVCVWRSVRGERVEREGEAAPLRPPPVDLGPDGESE